jgi:tetratricopeptide (TPR) repeat protein
VEEVSGSLKNAMGAYEQAVKLDPTNAEIQYNLGNVYWALSLHEKAAEHYKKAVKLKPAHKDALVNLSILSLETGDYASAAKYFDKAVALGYQIPKTYQEKLAQYRFRR